MGKSTLANLLAARPEYLNGVNFQKKFEVFSSSKCSAETTVDFYITADRIIILDCSPMLLNIQKREMVNSDLDDLKTMQILLQICHLIIFVHDGFPDLSMSRIIKLAKLMSPHGSRHQPLFASVANKVQPGTQTLPNDARTHDSNLNLIIPDFAHPSVELHHDIEQVVQAFQETVFMMKRWSMSENDEVFTEKLWGLRLIKAVEQIKKGDYFLRRYEALKDKFHQPVENS